MGDTALPETNLDDYIIARSLREGQTILTTRAHSEFIFYQHDASVTIPNAVWTPVPWNLRRTQAGKWTSYVPASTTIAAGSNGAILPQGTINVTNTSTFTSEGYLVVRISGTDRVIRYTGKTATTFTGCTLGVGTLATSQVIAQANVTFNLPVAGVTTAIADIAWASNGVGIRGTRFRFLDGVFNFPAATDAKGAVATTDPLLNTVAEEQLAVLSTPVISPLLGHVVEVFQSSTGNLDSVTSGLSEPRLVVIMLDRFEMSTAT